jgi:hypothetical protein
MAAAYGFAMVMIQINIDVRSYPLCLMFMLLALDCLVRFLTSAKGAHSSLLRFGVFMSAAIATEYYAILFWAACVLVLALWFLTVWPRYRDGVGKIALRIIGLPLVTCVVLYLCAISL